ncbi:calcium-binding protein [Alteromonas sp. ASW11-36]|uniref:Calcium-binding protein n=1 Tax=Alteromonas arenosi TaxID=3055817 RepID=A0ABT7SUU2_9ALTE|nr:calcium-binding protein [Alteromonas sp. ASW11-36]MDM7859957.1 calcium-binding protein [Alteromonas sp. ASW11-36]
MMTKTQKFTALAVTAAAVQMATMTPVHGQAELMALLDTDQDGFISLKEAVGDSLLLKNFGLIDTNEDGKISQEELLAASALDREDTQG